LKQTAAPKPVIVSWSGGKDSALSLHALSQDPSIDVVGLLTSVTRDYDRISIHGVRRALLLDQVEMLGLPLFEISLEPNCTNDAYEAAFSFALAAINRRSGVRHIAFGDLFLEDVRAYRERLLVRNGWMPLFPIWGIDTAVLARRFVDDGFAARVVCVDTTQIDRSFAGRSFDDQLLADLPAAVDPCGERGEFHTFVADGPLFTSPVKYTCGETVLRDERFMYCDLIPNSLAGERS
jgi:uncharacterized protein (TIGR00290 family)